MKKGKTKRVADVLSALMILLLGVLFWSGRGFGKHKEKLWLHRCNSLEKMREQHEEYPNIEVDVVFRPDRRFDITHEADTSFNLFLDSYFAHMAKDDGKIWLDIKNLSPGNAAVARRTLDSLAQAYRIGKERMIVESPCWQALEHFTKHRYYTSFYVDCEPPSQLEPHEVDTCIGRLRRLADKGVVRALSFPGWWYSTLKRKLGRSIDLLTWKHRSTQLELLFLPIGRRMLADSQLKVILVKDKGKYHR